MIEIKGYVCDYCNKAKKVKRVYKSPGSCRRHEKNCFRNPDVRACSTCRFWVLICDDDETPFKYCVNGHDRQDTGNCNGSLYDRRPTTECDFWEEERP